MAKVTDQNAISINHSEMAERTGPELSSRVLQRSANRDKKIIAYRFHNLAYGEPVPVLTWHFPKASQIEHSVKAAVARDREARMTMPGECAFDKFTDPAVR